MNHTTPKFEMLLSPRRLLFRLLAATFLTELLVIFVLLNLWKPGVSGFVREFMDSLILTLLILPFVWWWIIRPLGSAAMREKMLAANVISTSVDAIITIDERGRITAFNPAAEGLFGYAKNEAISQNVKLLMPSPEREQHDAHLGRYLRTGEKKVIGLGREVIAQRKDGVKFPIYLSVGEGREGSRPIFTGIVHDLTDRKRAEEQLQAKSNELAAMTQQLWQASRLATMGELAASIAHELNNPLATVGLRTENLLMQMPEDAEQRKPLEIIAQEVDRMAGLVENLLHFSRRGHRQVSTVDVREEIANSLGFVHYHLRNRNIEVVREFADQLATIQADRQQLRQLFLNLLTNASDAMPQGGKLTLRATANDAPEAVAIEFTDTGEGISAENLEKIWEPFFTTKPEGKGTGLGLAICRRIVEEHGGSINIQSQPGHGTTVRIVLPATTNVASDLE